MKVLILEDEVLIACDIAETLVDAGHSTIGPFAHSSDALNAIRVSLPDAAILDINLAKGSTSAPVASYLDHAGVPFVFLTARSRSSCALLQAFPAAPKLDKPTHPEELLRALDKVRGGSVSLNRVRAFSKWFSAWVMPPPRVAPAS